MVKGMYDVDNIAFHDIAVHGSQGWFCNIGYNALFQIDLRTGKTRLLEFFSDDYSGCKEIYAPIVYYNEKLYIAPRNGKHLCIYDIINKKFTLLDIDIEKYGDNQNFNLFNRVEVINDKIYFFPGRFHAIIELNPNSNKISYIDNWYDEISKDFCYDNINQMIIHNIHYDAEGNCLLPCWRNTKIIKINVCTLKYEIIAVKCEDEASLSDAVEIGEEIFFSLKNNKGIYTMDNKISVYANASSCKYSGGLFLDIYKDWLLMIPLFGDAIVRHNLKSNENEILYKFPDKRCSKCEWVPYKNNTFCHKKITDDKMIVFSSLDGKIILIRLKTGSAEALKIQLDLNSKMKIEEHFNELITKEGIFESALFGVENFLELVCDLKDIK